MTTFSKNYAKSVIYKIVRKDLTIKDIFVDSTSNLSAKITTHKHWARNPDHQLVSDRLMYSTVAAAGGFNNWECILIEAYPCSNPHELRARVRYWIEHLEANLNRVVQNSNTPIVHRTVAPKPKPHILTVAQLIAQPEEKQATCGCGSRAKDLKHKSHTLSIMHQNWIRSLVGVELLPYDKTSKAISENSVLDEIVSNSIQIVDPQA